MPDNDKPLRIVILTRDFFGSAWFVNQIHERTRVAAVLLETGKKNPGISESRKNSLFTRLKRDPKRNLARIISKAIRRVEINEREIFAKELGEKALDPVRKDIPLFKVQSANDPASVAIIKNKKPDLILVNGTGILKKPVIDIPSKGIINLHTGIVPQYRGIAGEFFALYNKDYGNIGHSIHFVTEKLDGGDIVRIKRIPFIPGDYPANLRARNIRGSIEGFLSAIKQFEDNSIKGLPQAGPGRLFTSKDMDEIKEAKVLIRCLLKKCFARRKGLNEKSG